MVLNRRLDGDRSVLAGIAIASALALTAQTPAPQSSALPYIGGTHAKGFCTMVRENAAVTVAGLMKNDELIGAGHRGALKLAHDQTYGTKEAMDLDAAYLGRVVASMSHNLALMRTLLSDQKRFPKTPASDDDRFAAMLKTQLLAAADRQETVLNRVNGLLETTSIGNGINEIDQNLAGSVSVAHAHSGATAPKTADQFLGATSLPGSGPGGVFELPGAGPGTLRGQTLWDKLALETQQTGIAAAEQTLTPTVVAAAAACR